MAGELNTVSDLGRYLKEQGLSPEQLARQVNISNMTLRRLLKKTGETRLPERYRVLLQLKLGGSQSVSPVRVRAAVQELGELKPLPRELERSGRKVRSVARIRRRIESALASQKFPGAFCTSVVRDVLLALRSQSLSRCMYHHVFSQPARLYSRCHDRHWLPR